MDIGAFVEIKNEFTRCKAFIFLFSFFNLINLGSESELVKTFLRFYQIKRVTEKDDK